MTHFRTYCIGEYDTDALYERFSEQTQVEPYKTGVVKDKDIIDFVEWYTKKGAEVPTSGLDIVRKLGQKGRRFVKQYKDAEENGNEEGMNEAIGNIMEQVFDRLYAVLGYNWNLNRWKKNDKGILEKWSTYNPNTVFDYFSPIGVETLGNMEDPELSIAESCGFFVGDGNTYTRFENVGWFGYSESVMGDEEKIGLVKQAIKDLPPDTNIYVFDCHI